MLFSGKYPDGTKRRGTEHVLEISFYWSSLRSHHRAYGLFGHGRHNQQQRLQPGKAQGLMLGRLRTSRWPRRLWMLHQATRLGSLWGTHKAAAKDLQRDGCAAVIIAAQAVIVAAQSGLCRALRRIPRPQYRPTPMSMSIGVVKSKVSLVRLLCGLVCKGSVLAHPESDENCHLDSETSH